MRAAALLLLGSLATTRGLVPLSCYSVTHRTPVAPRMAFAFGRSGTPEPSRPSEEAQGLYRMLGLAEDATYEEINEAYEQLCAHSESTVYALTQTTRELEGDGAAEAAAPAAAPADAGEDA